MILFINNEWVEAKSSSLKIVSLAFLKLSPLSHQLKTLSLHFSPPSSSIDIPHPMKKACPAPDLLSNPIAFILAVILLAMLPLILPQAKAYAETMEGQNYQLNLRQIFEEEPTSTPQPTQTTPATTPSPTPPPIVSYGESEIHFSDDFLDFGPLSPTTPVIRKLTVMVKGEYFPFTLYQQLDHNLLNDPGQMIPQTSCDNGSCSETQASIWDSTLTFGLGIRCDNITGLYCPDDYIEKNTYRPLGTNSQIIASGSVNGQANFTLTYKLIVPGTQPQGRYEANPTYILVPGI